MSTFSQQNIQNKLSEGERLKLQGETELRGLDLEGALAAHEAWKTKLELTLRGKNPEEYDPNILGVDHLCVLGRWLYGEGKSMDKYEEYVELLDAHARFHRCAGDILTKHRKGYLAEAIYGLRHTLPALSGEVHDNLVRLVRRERGY